MTGGGGSVFFFFDVVLPSLLLLLLLLCFLCVPPSHFSSSPPPPPPRRVLLLRFILLFRILVGIPDDDGLCIGTSSGSLVRTDLIERMWNHEHYYYAPLPSTVPFGCCRFCLLLFLFRLVPGNTSTIISIRRRLNIN